MVIASWLSEFITRTGPGVLELAAWLTAVATICAILWKASSRVRRAVRWLFRKNVEEPISAWMRNAILEVIAPVADDIKSAAKKQHDSQNRAIRNIKKSLDAHLDSHHKKGGT